MASAALAASSCSSIGPLSHVSHSIPTSFEEHAIPDGGSLESELCGSGETIRISPHGVPYLVDVDARHEVQLGMAMTIGASVLIGAFVFVLFCGLAGKRREEEDNY